MTESDIDKMLEREVQTATDEYEIERAVDAWLMRMAHLRDRERRKEVEA